MTQAYHHTSHISSERTIFYTHSTDLSRRGQASLQASLRISSLKYPSLHLRLPVKEDATALLHLFSDDRNVQYDQSCSGLNNIDAASNLIQDWQNVGQPLERANVVVVVDEKVVGVSGLGWIGRRSDGMLIGDAGMMLDSRTRGKGYGYESLCMVIDHGFRVLAMQEVHVSCVDANTAFKGLMNTKFGFEAKRTPHDRFGNEWIWRITRKLWRGSRHSAEGRERDR
ncbi:hypothetical protein BKA66DRAFT_473712 [Pyrenochaeta sp. MPI-SDFR-AT-0127]|nr:hypothetical protein BKA66DRAFT_473712 [Pyrenochaeta sp. MPI-SDFR-AT-0127]